MTLSPHSACVPAYIQGLPAAIAGLAKAEDYCAAHGLAPADLIGTRLAPDMWDFGQQIRAIAFHSSGALHAAIAGDVSPEFDHSPIDFAGLRGLLETALADVRQVTPAQIDPIGERDVTLRFGAHALNFNVQDFLLSFALPNFYFRTTAAYAILRAQGVPLGKSDFMGAIRFKTPAAG